MLICDKASIKGRMVMCSVLNDICIFGRFCTLSRKCFQDDGAFKCKLRCKDGKNNETSQDD